MTKLSQHEQRVVCVEAPCDPRTLRKYLKGTAVRPMAAVVIDRALRKIGRPDLVRTADAPATTTPDEG